jgi:hypothetical protein
MVATVWIGWLVGRERDANRTETVAVLADSVTGSLLLMQQWSPDLRERQTLAEVTGAIPRIPEGRFAKAPHPGPAYIPSPIHQQTQQQQTRPPACDRPVGLTGPTRWRADKVDPQPVAPSKTTTLRRLIPIETSRTDAAARPCGCGTGASSTPEKQKPGCGARGALRGRRVLRHRRLGR